MGVKKIPHNNGNYIISDTPDIEFANPIEHFSNTHIEMMQAVMYEMLVRRFPMFAGNIARRVTRKKAVMEWKEHYAKIMSTEIPPNLISLLTCNSKSEQEKLLKGQELTSDTLSALIFKAYSDLDFTFSHYSAEHHHKGLEEDELPEVVEVRKDKVDKVGESKLTDGQLKQAVSQRKVVVSKFLDRDDCWHCFFLTFKSIKGEERGEYGPHLHYVSDKFGMTRERVLTNLRDRKYNLGSLPHIIYNKD